MDNVAKLEKLAVEIENFGNFVTTHLDRINQTLTIYETETHIPLYQLTLDYNSNYKLTTEPVVIESKSSQQRPYLDLTYYSLLLGLIYNYIVEE